MDGVLEKKIIKIKLKRSVIGTKKSHRATALGLGLRRVNQISELQNSPAVRGMIKKISYLLEVME